MIFTKVISKEDNGIVYLNVNQIIKVVVEETKPNLSLYIIDKNDNIYFWTKAEDESDILKLVESITEIVHPSFVINKNLK